MNKLEKTMIIQLICVMVLAILVVLCIWFPFLICISDLFAGLTFFVVAYNKRKTKPMFIISIIFGVLFTLVGMVNLFNG